MNDDLTRARLNFAAVKSAVSATQVTAERDEHDRLVKVAALDAAKARHEANLYEGSKMPSDQQESAVNAAIASNSDVVRAGIEMDFASRKAAISNAAHARAKLSLDAAEAEFRAAAIAFAHSEDIELAQKCEAARKAYEHLCSELQSRTVDGIDVPVNVALPKIPKAVEEALDRMPARDPFNTPVSEMFKRSSFKDWQARIERIMAGEPVEYIALPKPDTVPEQPKKERWNIGRPAA